MTSRSSEVTLFTVRMLTTNRTSFYRDELNFVIHRLVLLKIKNEVIDFDAVAVIAKESEKSFYQTVELLDRGNVHTFLTYSERGKLKVLQVIAVTIVEVINNSGKNEVIIIQLGILINQISEIITESVEVSYQLCPDSEIMPGPALYAASASSVEPNILYIIL